MDVRSLGRIRTLRSSHYLLTYNGKTKQPPNSITPILLIKGINIMNNTISCINYSISSLHVVVYRILWVLSASLVLSQCPLFPTANLQPIPMDTHQSYSGYIEKSSNFTNTKGTELIRGWLSWSGSQQPISSIALTSASNNNPSPEDSHIYGLSSRKNIFHLKCTSSSILFCLDNNLLANLLVIFIDHYRALFDLVTHDVDISSYNLLKYYQRVSLSWHQMGVLAMDSHIGDPYNYTESASPLMLFVRDEVKENGLILDAAVHSQGSTRKEHILDRNKLFKWFGKAFILTNEARLSDESIFTAKSCGFDPYLFPVDKPWTHIHGSKQSYVNYCLQTVTGSDADYQNMAKIATSQMTLGDIAYIGTQRKVLQTIIKDESITDEDWALVLDENVRLHPDVTPAYVRELIAETIISQRLNYAYGFMFLGTCHAHCKTPGARLSHDCVGSCSFAYAISKRRAQFLFEEMYCRAPNHRRKMPCGLNKDNNRFGQSLAHHFSKPQRSAWDRRHHPRAIMLGLNLLSPVPQDQKSFGVLYLVSIFIE